MACVQKVYRYAFQKEIALFFLSAGHPCSFERWVDYYLIAFMNTRWPVNTHEHPREHPVFKMAWTPNEHPSGEHPADEAGSAETQ